MKNWTSSSVVKAICIRKDVYKRQTSINGYNVRPGDVKFKNLRDDDTSTNVITSGDNTFHNPGAVSYTHLVVDFSVPFLVTFFCSISFE